VGVNVVGHFRDASGLAEATRSTARALRSIATPYVEVDVGPTHARVAPTAGGTSPPHAFVTSIFHDNVAHALTTGQAFGKRYFAERRTIGYLYWEVEGLPEAYTPALDQFDEIWAPTEFVAKNIANHTERPVHVVQPNVEVADAKPPCRSSFGLPGGRFLFLALASVHSVVERKNPLGAVDAFSRAFTGAELAEVGLVLKVSNLSLRPDLRSAIEEATRRLPIFVLEETLTRADTLGLMASVDVLVSLHRGEGFGLPVAEAMALGVPTIASAFSGNVDFTTADTSIPVPCKVVTLERDYGPYLAGCRWAEPDIDAAAQAMRRLRDDSTLRESIVANGRRFILDRFSPAATAEALRSRLPR
jgi:glycosyltransferase involved in cell wall biosynthesis